MAEETALKAETIDVFVTIRSRWVVEEDTPEAREQCMNAVTHYISQDNDSGIFDDFGYKAWGGYDGPRVIQVEVIESSSELSKRGD